MMSFLPTMAATLASPRTTEIRAARRLPLLGSRIGRRMVGLFVLSAVLPVSLCAMFLIHGLGGQLSRTEQQNLHGLAHNLGMTLLGRLGSADDVLGTIITRPGVTDVDIVREVARLDWARSVRFVEVAAAPGLPQAPLPAPDARQRAQLARKGPAVLYGQDQPIARQVFLLRELPDSALLYVELSPQWLWSDASDYAVGASVVIVDEYGGRIFPTGSLPSRAGAVSPTGAPDGRWQAASWELFLGGRFATPSWRVVAAKESPTLVSGDNAYDLLLLAFIPLSILLVTWLSMTAIRRQLEPLALLTQATKRVARRDFPELTDVSWKDEFGDLARAFGSMSNQLKKQFAALETLSEIDRLLLQAPELESILNKLLPRIAQVLHCDSVSVLLFDADSPGHARSYDYFAAESAPPSVRRIADGVAELRASLQPGGVTLWSAGHAGSLFLEAMSKHGIGTVQPHALYRSGGCTGALCIGHVKHDAHREHSGLEAGDFADRLSLILTSLQQAAALHRQANFDAVTGLQNRQFFGDQLLKAVAAAQTDHGEGALLYIDLDQFKHVNDTAGHGAGDHLLRVVGERLMANSTDGRTVARLGGDEFAVLLPRISSAESAWQSAALLIAALEQAIEIGGRQHRISASVGIAIFPQDGVTLEQLFRSGDIAMYQAKEAGRGRAVFFESEMQEALQRRVLLVNAMHQALQHDGFVVHYQPIVQEGQGEIAAEALVRWPGKSAQEWISPATFIPIAEETDQIIKLGEWVLRTACKQFGRWRAHELGIKYLSVNVSVRQLSRPDFAARLSSILRESGMRGGELQLEVTESALAAGAQLEQTLEKIVAQGVRLALDDFGTGYSSLSYLRRFPIHTVKIDRSFIQELPADPAACRLAQSIVAMCGALGKDVVAEGVETTAQRDFLRSAGCTTIQGYLVAKPMDAAAISDFVRQFRSQLAPRMRSGPYLVAP